MMEKIRKTRLLGGILIATVGLLLVYFVLILTDRITLDKTPLSIGLGLVEKVYDGTPLTSNAYVINSGSLREGHRIEVCANGSILFPGETENCGEVRIYDEMGADVSDEYLLEVQPGRLRVLKRKITLTSDHGEQRYNGSPLTAEGYKISAGSLAPEDRVSVQYLSKRTLVGESENRFAARIYHHTRGDVSQGYEITYRYGTLSVYSEDRKVLLISTESAEKTYDGEPLIAGGYTLLSSPQRNHRITNVLFDQASQTEVGFSENRLRFVIQDNSGRDVSDEYHISYREVGILRVEGKKITVTTPSKTKIYDGTALESEEKFRAERESSFLLPGHKLFVVIIGSQTYQGTSFNQAAISIIDKYGENVNHCYNIEEDFGILRVRARSLTFKTEGASVPYTPLAVTRGGFTFLGGLAPNDRLVAAHTVGVCTSPGRVENSISYRVENYLGKDVTFCYQTEYCPLGMLEMKQIPLTVRTASAEKIYDGIPLDAHTYQIEEGALLSGDRIDVEFLCAGTAPGVFENAVSIRIFAEDGTTDRTDYYAITVIPGTLTVYDPPPETEESTENDPEGGPADES